MNMGQKLNLTVSRHRTLYFQVEVWVFVGNIDGDSSVGMFIVWVFSLNSYDSGFCNNSRL